MDNDFLVKRKTVHIASPLKTIKSYRKHSTDQYCMSRSCKIGECLKRTVNIIWNSIQLCFFANNCNTNNSVEKYATHLIIQKDADCACAFYVYDLIYIPVKGTHPAMHTVHQQKQSSEAYQALISNEDLLTCRMRTGVKNKRLFYLQFCSRLGHRPGSARRSVNFRTLKITLPLKEQFTRWWKTK